MMCEKVGIRYEEKLFHKRGRALDGGSGRLLFAGRLRREKGRSAPVESAQGALGSHEEPLVCYMGRSTIANPKFPEGDTYEDNAYTRYLKAKLNVVVKDDFEANGADYDRQVSLAIASGELPDIMKVGSKDILDELVENGLVADLAEAYNQYASGYIKEIYDSYGGRCLNMATYDGRLMAIPGTNLDSAPASPTSARIGWISWESRWMRTGTNASPWRSFR